MDAIFVAALDGQRPVWIGASALRRLLPPIAAVEAVERALADAGEHAESGHAALATDVDGGAFHVKTATLGAPRAVYVAKVNANFPGNPERGLPTIQGVAALFDATDGRLLALVDSPELTALRTGAATAVAARRLARREASRLLVYGAGRQAEAQIAALAAVLPLETVWIHDLDAARAAEVAAVVGRELRLAAVAVHDPDAVVRRADIVVTCTSARTPILSRQQVEPGTFVAAVGADHPSKQEIDPELAAASRYFVDSLAQALASGDLHHAVAAGAMSADGVAGRLDELVTGTTPGRRSADEITLFDSTGIAVEDAAAALAAYERLVAENGSPA